MIHYVTWMEVAGKTETLLLITERIEVKNDKIAVLEALS